MALAQRSASRFFAAFYRWELHTRSPRLCASNSKHYRNGICTPQHYHATRFLQQGQAEPQVQDEPIANPSNDARGTTDGAKICMSRPADSIRKEIASTQSSAQEQDASPELSEAEMKQAQMKDSVRQLMRKVPSSVAIITVAHIDPKTGMHVPMGVAVSSLSTVTLDPPTVSFNIKEPSQTLDAIRAANGLFRVHFPAADRGGAGLVDLFCRGNHADAYNMRAKMLKLYQPKDKKHPSSTRSSAPQILNDFVLAAMECEATHQFPVVDHVILVAKVHDIEQKVSKDSAIVYIDRGYRKPKGNAIFSSVNARAPATTEGVWSVWEFPLFPGEKERRNYLKEIKDMIKADPAYYEKPTKDTYRGIDASLPYPAANFGISLELLVAECRKEMGLADGLRPGLRGQQVLSDFYGPLTPSMKDQIVKRAKKLIARDSRFLSQHYRMLLHNLGVNPNSRDFLPSDIMKPLRAANLIPPSEPQTSHADRMTEDIRKVEQIEYRLQEHLRKMSYPDALKEPFEDAMVAIGEKKEAHLHFKKCRARLLTQSHPTLFDASAIDITGEVTQEELRVVLRRILNRLQFHSQVEFRKQIRVDWCEALRRVRVNPTISGMDVEFLMAKIKHMFYSTRQFEDFTHAVEEMIKPWFAWNIGWEDLEERVKRFVQTNPLRATAWQRQDRLAAMGLHWNATVSLPNQDNPNEEASKPLNEGLILDTLVAKELKRHYGNGTEEENKGIAKYLKEMYNFDVTDQPIQYSPKESASQSSGDEMQEAMMADLTPAQQQVWLNPPKPGYKSGNTPSRGQYRGGFTAQQESQKKWGTYFFDQPKES